MLIIVSKDIGGKGLAAINTKRVDGIVWDERIKKTKVFVGGADDPFYADEDLDSLVKRINGMIT